MAETRGGKRYGHGPKIADKGEKSQGTEHKDETPARETKGAAPQETEAQGDVGAKGHDAPTPSETTGGKVEPGLHETRNYEMPTHERHLAERKEMMKRHGDEMGAMHERHGKEHADMAKRHEKELGAGAEKEAA